MSHTFDDPAARSTVPADRAARAARLAEARLYLCTDARSGPDDLARFLEEVLAGGVDVVQLRQKGMEASDELQALAVVTRACRRHGALVAVNDRADLAYVAGADVLHLGQDDLPVTAARALLGDGILMGRSSHAVRESEAALAQDGVDYVAVGPCWPTPTKPGRPAPGLELVRHVAGLAPSRPWFAIGGIDPGNVGEVTAAGASRIVVVRALTQAPDPRAAAQDLARSLQSA